MSALREAAQQALEALTNCTSEHGHRCTRCDSEMDEGGRIVAALRAALAQQEKTCNCRWVGDVQTQQCTLHEAHVDAIHEWAERAKTAEAALAQQEQEQEPVAIVEGVVPHLEVIIIKHILGARFPKIGDFLYTTPPRREWKSLSEEEIADAQDAAAIHFRESRHGVRGQQLMPSDSPDWWLARAIEAKLKEKNA